jgi:hypothetical protein
MAATPPHEEASELLDVLADVCAATPAAARCTVAQILLDSPCAIHLTGVHIPFRIGSDDMRPVEIARLAASSSNAIHFLQVLPVDNVDRKIREVGDVHAALLRIG